MEGGAPPRVCVCVCVCARVWVGICRQTVDTFTGQTYNSFRKIVGAAGVKVFHVLCITARLYLCHTLQFAWDKAPYVEAICGD